MTTVERLFIGGPAHGKRDLIESSHAMETVRYSAMEMPQNIEAFGRWNQEPQRGALLNTRIYHYHHALQSQGRAVYMLEGLEGAEALVDVLFNALEPQ